MTTRPLDVDVSEVKRLVDQGEELVLLDCRERHEYDTVRLEGARLFPVREIPARMGELEPLNDRHIVVYCHHGIRSLYVTQWLRQNGFPKAQNMQGGIDAWSLQVDPSLPRY
jgi:rhodanese-related sulfurtransferase